MDEHTSESFKDLLLSNISNGNYDSIPAYTADLIHQLEHHEEPLSSPEKIWKNVQRVVTILNETYNVLNDMETRMSDTLKSYDTGDIEAEVAINYIGFVLRKMQDITAGEIHDLINTLVDEILGRNCPFGDKLKDSNETGDEEEDKPVTYKNRSRYGHIHSNEV